MPARSSRAGSDADGCNCSIPYTDGLYIVKCPGCQVAGLQRQYCLDADMRGAICSEWDETKQHDVLFLLTVRPPDQAEL